VPYSYIQYQVITQPVFVGGEVISEDKWHFPWSEPVRFKQGLAVYLQPSNVTTDFLKPIVLEDKWHQAWSIPSVLAKPGLSVTQQPVLAYGSIKPVVSFAYYNWLSEPVRIKPGLRAQYHPFATQDTKFIPSANIFLQGWYSPLSEPVRFKRGLPPYTHPDFFKSAQDFIRGFFITKEIDSDSAIFAINVIQSQPAVTARVSITEVGGFSPTSVREV